MDPGFRRGLLELLDVPEGASRSALEGWRKGPRDVSGQGQEIALERTPDIHGVRRANRICGGPASREQEVQRAGRSWIASAISSVASSAMKCPARVSRWFRSGAHAFQTAAAS